MPLFAQKKKTPLGIYVHIPFCRSKCRYCDFYSVTELSHRLADGYLQAMVAHIRESGALAPDYRVDTVYFGGGTPTYFGAEGMAVLLDAIRKSFDVAPNAEITFEANPDSVTPRLLRRLRSEGFNRVSLGVQCDSDEMLQKLGRPHTFQQAVDAVQAIRKAGYRNLSLDLMYGLPGQTLESWTHTLRRVLSLAPDHMSCYGLKVEEGTPLYEEKDSCDLPDDDLQADMYLAAVEILRMKGYRQYEISNFARKGMVSKHNMKYWLGGEYLGFGPGASSDFAGKRFDVIRDLAGYLEGIRHGGEVIVQVQEIPVRERAGEYLMTRLRTTTGIVGADYEKRFLLPFGPLEEVLEGYGRRGLASRAVDGRWYLTPEGFLLSNTIISDLLIAQERTVPGSM